MNRAEQSLIENLGDITAEIVRVQKELNGALKENIAFLKRIAEQDKTLLANDDTITELFAANERLEVELKFKNDYIGELLMEQDNDRI